MQMSAIDDELDTAKKISTDLVGPVYDADLSVNHFKEVVMHAEAIRQELIRGGEYLRYSSERYRRYSKIVSESLS